MSYELNSQLTQPLDSLTAPCLLEQILYLFKYVERAVYRLRYWLLRFLLCRGLSLWLRLLSRRW